MKPTHTLRRFLAIAGSAALTISCAHAANYYWDDNAAGANFGTAGANTGTWAAPTAGPTAGWSLSGTGANAFAGFTTATTDTLNFGNGATGLAAGTITVSGTVDAGNITFASGSGAIVLSGGTINLAATQTTTVNNTTNTINSILSGAGTSLTKAGSGALILGGNNTYTGATIVNAGAISITHNNALGSTAGVTTINGSNTTTYGLLGTNLILSEATTDLTVAEAFNFAATADNTGRVNIENDSARNHTLSGAINVTSSGAGARVTFNAEGGGSITISGGISGNMGGVSNPLLVLRGDSASSAFGIIGTGRITGNITFTGGKLVKTDNSIWTLSGTNTYTGATEVANGILVFANKASKSASSAVSTTNALGTVGLGVHDSDAAYYSAANVGSLFNGTLTGFTMIAGSGVAIDTTNAGGSFIQNVALTAARPLTKLGTGTLTLSVSNSYTGATTVNEGTLIAGLNAPSGSAGAFGNATSDINLGVAGGGAAASILTGGAFTIGRIIRNVTANNTDAGTRVLTLGGNTAHNSVFSGNIFLGTTDQTSKGIQLTAAAGGQVTFSGVIQNPSGQTGGEITAAAALTAVTKVGAGTVILSGNNTYTGLTTVNEGTLLTTKAAALPGYNAASRVSVLSGATLAVNVDSGGWTSGQIDSLLGATPAAFAAGSNLGIEVTTGSFTYANNIGVTQADKGLIKSGAGTLLSSASNTYTGATSITGGTLLLGNNTATGNLSGTSSITVTGATLAVNRINAFTQATDLNNKVITGTGGFTQAGSGTTTLSLANTYQGATAVNAGTLEISSTGTINSTSGVTIASAAFFIYNSSTALNKGITNNGGTIGGVGSIGVAVAMDSTSDVLAPGNSPGIQPFGVSQSWAGMTYEWEVNDFIAGVAGTNYDQIAITGNLDITGAAPGSYILDLISLTAGNVAGVVPNFSEINRTWNILTTTGTITGFNASFWTIDHSTGPNTFTSSPTWAGNWSLATNGTNDALVLSYTAIPEPGAALLGSFGMLLIIRRRRN